MKKIAKLFVACALIGGGGISPAWADWHVDGSMLKEVVAEGTPWIFNVAVSGTDLTLKTISQRGDATYIDLDAPIEGGYSIIKIPYSGSPFHNNKTLGGLTFNLPRTLQTTEAWVCDACTATILIPEENAIASLGQGSFRSSGLSGKVALSGNVTFGSNNSAGILESSAIQELVLGKDIAICPLYLCKKCSSLTNYTSSALVHTINAWALQDCKNLKEYHFASYPTLNSNWNNGAKTGTGVRTFIPDTDANWDAKIRATTFTPWEKCSSTYSNDYFTAFGQDATPPLGYTTLPYATWLLYEPKESGASLLIDGDPEPYGSVNPDYGMYEGVSSGLPCSAEEYSGEGSALWRVTGWELDVWQTPQEGEEKTWVPVDSKSGTTYTFKPQGNDSYRLLWKWEPFGYQVSVSHIARIASVITNAAGSVQGFYVPGSTASFTANGEGFVRWTGAPPGVDASQRTISFVVDRPVALVPLFANDWTYDAAAKTISNGDWTFPVSANGTRLTLHKSGVVVGGCNFIDFDRPVRDGNGVVYAIVNPGDYGDCYFYNLASTGLENGIILPATLETVPPWAFQRFKSPILLPEKNAVVNLGVGAFSESGLTGKLMLNGHVSFDPIKGAEDGAFYSSAIQSVELGEDVANYPWATFQGCLSLTNYTSRALSHTISGLRDCANLNEYRFACYPALESNWNKGAKTGTGVRTFVPRGNADWRAKMKQGTFTKWAKCSDANKDAYFAAFGAGAEIPKGYTTSPYATWLMEYGPGNGFILIVR